MPARAALYDLLSADPELQALGLEAVYPKGAVDTPPETVWLVITHDPRTPAFGNRGSERVSFWVYDRGSQDYAKAIDPIIERVKRILSDATHVSGSDGATLTTATWAGDGPDLMDVDVNALTRWTDFTVVSRYDDGESNP